MIHQVIFMQLTSMDANFLPNDTDAGEGQGLYVLTYLNLHGLCNYVTILNIILAFMKLNINNLVAKSVKVLEQLPKGQVTGLKLVSYLF